jgi:two-component system, sensor histidine kinase and response regulator
VINDILDFSKIESGNLTLTRTDFDVRAMVDKVMKLASVQAAQKGLEIGCEISPEVPRAVHGDETCVRRAPMNLVGNAIKFRNRGGVRVRVEAEGGRVHFEVRDTGIGIPCERQAIIFEPFSQADGSYNRRFGGTGLGLTISSWLVAMTGGRIWVESEEGGGATFHFTIPAGN